METTKPLAIRPSSAPLWTGIFAGPFAFAETEYVRGILQAAGFTEIAVAFHEYEIEAPENAIMDDAQLVFLGVPPEKMPQARTAVDRHMTRFRLSSGLCRYPLAVQIFTARNPAL